MCRKYRITCTIIYYFTTGGCQPVPVLVTRLGGLAKEYRKLSKQVDHLKERIVVCCETNGIEVDDDMHKDLKVNHIHLAQCFKILFQEIASQNASFIDDLPPKKIF